ncbi:hypothetical protein niasHT_037636 [Heterodera trifolii]|uniref:Uncharacterized protein n=1 Tax=Heterodera trifolii TaxID=157864 RepID=A0ABD2IH13_9BILA
MFNFQPQKYGQLFFPEQTQFNGHIPYNPTVLAEFATWRREILGVVSPPVDPEIKQEPEDEEEIVPDVPMDDFPGNDENQPPEIGPAPPFGPVHQNALGMEFGPLPQHAFGPMNQHALGQPQLFGPAAQVHGVWQPYGQLPPPQLYMPPPVPPIAYPPPPLVPGIPFRPIPLHLIHNHPPRHPDLAHAFVAPNVLAQQPQHGQIRPQRWAPIRPPTPGVALRDPRLRRRNRELLQIIPEENVPPMRRNNQDPPQPPPPGVGA